MLTQSFDEQAHAEMFKRLIESGQTGEQAAKAMAADLDGTPTFASLIPEYLAHLTDLTPHTIRTYERQLNLHITPIIGDLRLGQLTEQDAERVVASLVAKRLAPKTVKNIHAMFHSVLKYAIKRKFIVENVAEGVRLPKRNATQDSNTFLTRLEFIELMRYVDEFYHPLFFFLVGTGLRFGEAAALLGGDFDDDGKGLATVRVTKAIKRDDVNGWYVGPPKSQRSVRTVPIPPQVAAMVAPLVKEAGRAGNVFSMKRGGQLVSKSIHHRVWQPAISRALADGYRKKPRIHDLRHTYASWMLAGDPPMDLFGLSGLMGHESTSTTQKVYAHLMPDTYQRAAAIGAGIFGEMATAARQLES